MNRIINLRKFSSIPNRVMNLKIKDSIGIVEFNNPKNSVNIINQDLKEFTNSLSKNGIQGIVID